MTAPVRAPLPSRLPVRPDGERPLAALAPGARGVIVRVEGHDPAAQRLLDLGFVPDTPVAVVRRAPLGDPVEYAVRGTRICLRRAESRRIVVRPAGAGGD